MWAYSLTAPRKYEKVEVPTPVAADLKEGHVLLRTLAGAVCGSDLAGFNGHRKHMFQDQGPYSPNYPGFPMHETVGEVLASKHPLFTAGQRVVGWASDDDGVKEFIMTDGEKLAVYDEGLEPTMAIAIQTLACVIYAVDQIGDVQGLSAAVFGLGPIGVLFSHVLKSRGASHITGVDLVDRTDLAADFGVDECIHGSSERYAEHVNANGKQPNLVVEAIGHQAVGMRDAIEAVAPFGQIFQFGIPDKQPISFDLWKFLRKALTLRAGTTESRHRYLEIANEHLKDHPGFAEKYVTHVVDIADVQHAYDLASTPAKGQLKVAVKMA